MLRNIVTSLFFLYTLFFLVLTFSSTTLADDTLLYDDFNDGDASGWSEINPWGSWGVYNSEYVGEATLYSSPASPSYSINGSQDWANYDLNLNVKSELGIDKQVLFRVNQSENRSYIFNMRSTYFNGGNDAILAKREPIGSESASVLTIVNFQNNPNQWYKVHINVFNEEEGVRIKIYIDESLIINYLDNDNPILSGSIGLEVVPGGYQGNPIGLITRIHYDDIKVSAITPPISFTTIKQYDPSWANIEYDTASQWSPIKTGINRWGCALTSAAMILTKYGHNINPASLNTWLLQNDGYVGNGFIDWSAVTKYAKLSHELNPLSTKLEYKRYAYSAELADSEISANKPFILKLLRTMDNGSHFVVAHHKNENGIQISDPASENTDLTSYSNYILKNMETFTPSNTDLSYLYLYINPNIQMSVYDPIGTLLSDRVFNEDGYIDQISSVVGPQKKLRVLSLPKPVPGRYTIRLKGSGIYNLQTRIYDTDAKLKKNNSTGNINASQQDTYFVNLGSDGSLQKVDYEFVRKSLKEGYDKGFIFTKNQYRVLLGFIEASEKQFKKGNEHSARMILEGLLSEIRYGNKFIKQSYSKELKALIEYLKDGL